MPHSPRVARVPFLALALLAMSPVAAPKTWAQSVPVAAPSRALDAALPDDLKLNIDAAVNQILSSTNVPSASIAIVTAGRIAYLQAYGQARLSPAMEAKPQMQYSIGAISKQFTAAAVLLLAQEGKLSLDDPVSKYLPELTRSGEVTLRMLLSHTSGYQDYWPEDYVMTSMLAPTTAQHILDVWGKRPLDFDPGTQWQYSNTNYVIAGRIVEQVSGMALIDLLEKRIFLPLGMVNVYDADASRLPATDPTGYERHALGPPRPSPQEGAGWMFAAGELAMPAHDLALWDISLIDRSLLGAASYTEMFTPVLLKSGAGSGYGLGVFLEKREGHAVIEHSGEVSGFVSENLVFPDDRAAIVVLTNEMASPAASLIGRRLTPIVLGTGAPAPSKAEAQALAIFNGLADGHLDRSLFTKYCNAYFSQQTIDDFAASLKPLGPPLSFKETKQEARGGMTFHVFTVTFPERELRVTTYEMPDGKLEQYLVMP
jgi:D-alanyl-D-alanine carboxypeptidase